MSNPDTPRLTDEQMDETRILGAYITLQKYPGDGLCPDVAWRMRDEVLRLRVKLAARDEALEKAVEALEQYSDKDNWGYYDGSGCPKGYGSYEEACFIGTSLATQTLAEIKEVSDGRS